MGYTEALPESVRYIKNGPGGCWWKLAKTNGELHGGWSDIPTDVLISGDLALVGSALRVSRYSDGKRGFQQDFNQLAALLDRPSRHVWITFQDSCMWWSTVLDGIAVSDEGATRHHGHFWLTCDLPWSNKSLGDRLLSIANLPGVITRTKGFKGTICEPVGWKEALRVIRHDPDGDAIVASKAREAYARAVHKLVSRLHEKDFETLLDLILSRNGWARLDKVGGATQGWDIQAENIAIDEIAVIQVKCSAGQSALNEAVENFEASSQFQRMIFAVHSPSGRLTPPTDPRV